MNVDQYQQVGQRSDGDLEHPLTITLNGAIFVEVPYESQRHLDAVSISRRGRIGLHRQFVDTYRAVPQPRAKLYWDSATRVITIVIVKREPTAFPIHSVASRGGAMIDASSFFSACDLQPAELAGWYRYEVKPVRDVGIRNVPEDHKACIVMLDSNIG